MNKDYEELDAGSVAVINETEKSEPELNTVQAAPSTSIKVKGGRVYAFFKRAFDIVFSLISLIVLSPLFLIIAILIKCTSRGKVFYVSKRVGKNGKIFKFYKFRSMRDGAEQELDTLLNQNMNQGITFKMKDDPRITKIGKFLRKSSIDELPQLINILKGDMSLVGPRPGTLREYELYSDYDKQRLLVPQGLTGEWQVRGRSKIPFKQMVELDLNYIAHKRSFWYDIKLIFMTFGAVLRQDGAE
ncbi:MAG: sugar transferase [Erysipelotrichales bacterium]|nr:sugar transferase [Erysipelotrichales bacterium]